MRFRIFGSRPLFTWFYMKASRQITLAVIPVLIVGIAAMTVLSRDLLLKCRENALSLVEFHQKDIEDMEKRLSQLMSKNLSAGTDALKYKNKLETAEKKKDLYKEAGQIRGGAYLGLVYVAPRIINALIDLKPDESIGGLTKILTDVFGEKLVDIAFWENNADFKKTARSKGYSKEFIEYAGDALSAREADWFEDKINKKKVMVSVAPVAIGGGFAGIISLAFDISQAYKLFDEADALDMNLEVVKLQEERMQKEVEANRAILEKRQEMNKQAKAFEMDLRRYFEKANLVLSSAAMAIPLLIIFISLVLIRRLLIIPIKRVVAFADHLKSGNLDVNLKEGVNEIGKMGAHLNEVVAVIKGRSDLAMKIAEGDLCQNVYVGSEEDTLGKALESMISGLTRIVLKLSDAVGKMDGRVSEVYETSASLTKSAEEQAVSVDQMKSAAAAVGVKTKKNLDSADKAADMAENANKTADIGRKRMDEMTAAMEDIARSGEDIVKIVKTIDDIAFQTNLLSLNAAVEAASAGKHGRGFAIVAGEVRNLAGRSAKAAGETANMINMTVRKVQNGTAIVSKTSEALENVKKDISIMVNTIEEMSAAGNEQFKGISEIENGLALIDNVTKETAKSAIQTSDAAEALSRQVVKVREAMSMFVINAGQISCDDNIRSEIYELDDTDESGDGDDYAGG